MIENESQPLPIPDDSDELFLIAYMDNELPPEQRRIFEKRLAQEPLLRQKLTEFEKTWDELINTAIKKLMDDIATVKRLRM